MTTKYAAALKAQRGHATKIHLLLKILKSIPDVKFLAMLLATLFKAEKHTVTVEKWGRNEEEMLMRLAFSTRAKLGKVQRYKSFPRKFSFSKLIILPLLKETGRKLMNSLNWT